MNRPPLSPQSCITLDAAGTLFHLRQPVGHTYMSIAARHGIHLQADVVDKAFRAAWKVLPSPYHEEGMLPRDDDRGWWRTLVDHTLLGALGGTLPTATVDAFFAELYAHFADANLWQLYDDALPALEMLHPHFRLFVVSNFDRRLHSILLGLGVRKYFEGVIVSSEVGASKPHPRIFQRVLQLADTSARECVHIGDDERCDFEGARSAGMGAILLSRPEVTLRTAAEKILSGGISRLRADV